MTPKEINKARKVVLDLLKICKIAMPDTYYETDTRVARATHFLKLLRKEETNHGVRR